MYPKFVNTFITLAYVYVLFCFKIYRVFMYYTIHNTQRKKKKNPFTINILKSRPFKTKCRGLR